MERLSDRLQTIALEIFSGETMADIGTDHGFLPLFLWKNGVCPRVILTDISVPSLNKAKANAGAAQFGRDVMFRAGSGLEVLEAGEVDDVVIAGMGGMQMIRILAVDPDKSRSFSKLILQPRNHVGELRHWLLHHGFAIDHEALVRENGRLCEVLTVFPALPVGEDGSDPQDADAGPELMLEPPDSIRWEVPEELFRIPPGEGAKDGEPDLWREYVENKILREKRIFEELGNSRRPDADERRERARANKEYLEGLLR